MGALKMLGLMLWKAIVQRKRQPMVLFLEILWPVLIFTVVVLVRRTSPPISKPTCHYAPRALPNSGFRFLQSFVCGLDNVCHEDEANADIKTDPRMAQFLKAVGPLYSEANLTRNMIRSLPKAQSVFKGLNELIENPDIKELIGMKLNVSDIFKNPTEVKAYFVDRKIIPSEVVDAIMESQINITRVYDLTDFVDFKGIACDPDQLEEFLVIPSPVGVAKVSETLCNINDSLVPDIVTETQKQISISNIIRMLSKLERVVGDYDDAMMMEDISSMLDVLIETRSFNELMKSASNLQNITQWVNKAVDYYQQSMDAFDVHSFQKILRDIEPFVTSQFERYPWWSDFKKVVATGYMGAHWVQNGVKDLHDLPMTLGDLITMTADGDSMIRQSVNISRDIMHLLSQAHLDIVMMSQQLDWFVADPDAHQLLCVDPGFVKLFRHPNREGQSKMKAFQESLCELDPDQLNEYMSEIFNYQNLIASVERVQKDQLDITLSTLNWTELYITAERLLGSTLSFSDIMSTFFNSADNLGGVQGMWQQIAQSAERSVGWSSATELNLAYQLQPILGTFDAVAKASGNFSQDLHMFYYSSRVVVDILQTLRNRTVDLPQRLDALLTENPEFGELLEEILSSEELTSTLIELISNNKKLQVIIDNTKDLNVIFCEDSTLKMLFTNDEGKLLITTENARNLLCNKNLEGVADELSSAFDLSDLQAKFEIWIRDLMNPQSMDATNTTALLNDISGFFTFAYPPNPWESILQNLGVSGLDADKHLMQLTSIQASYSSALLKSMTTTLGPMVESSPVWPQMAPILEIAIVYAEFSLLQNEFLMDILANDSAFMVLLYQGMEHGPQLLSAMAKTLSDSAKIEEVTSDLEWASRICKPDCEEFINLFEIPRGIPLEEIIQTVRATMEEVWAHNEHIAVFMKNIEREGLVNEKFNWTRLANMLKASSAASAATSAQSLSFGAFKKLFSAETIGNFQQAMNDVYVMLMALSSSNNQGVTEMTTGLMDMLDQSFSNSMVNVSDVIKYYAYYGNELLKDTNAMMKMMNDGSINFDAALANSTILQDVFRDSMDMMPAAMDAIKNTVLNPEKMMKMIFEVDFSNVKLCDGIEITSAIDFEDKEKAAEFEKKLCSIDYNTLATEVMASNTGVAYITGRVMQSTKALMAFNVTLMPRDYEMDMKELMDNAGLLLSHMQNMTMTDQDLMAMLPTNMLDVTTLTTAMKDFDETFKKMDLNQLADMTSIMKFIMPMIQNLNGNSVDMEVLEKTMARVTTMNFTNSEETLTNLMKTIDDTILPTLLSMSGDDDFIGATIVQQLKIYDAFYTFGNNILTQINDSGAVNFSDMFSSKMNQILMLIGPETFEKLLNDIMALLTQQTKIEAITANWNTLETFCTNGNAYQDILPTLAETLNSNSALKNLICENGNESIAEILGSLASDTVAKYTNAISTAYDPEASKINISIGDIVIKSNQMTALLTQLTSTTVNINFGSLTDLFSDAKWEEFSRKVFEDVTKSFEYMNTDNMTQSLETNLYTSLGQAVASIPSAYLTEMNQYVLFLIDMQQSWAGGTVNLHELLEGNPEAQKLLTNLKYFPVLYETFTYTSAIKSQALSQSLAEGVTGICVDEAYNDIFVVRANHKEEFEMAMQDLCKINTTALAMEMAAYWTVTASPNSVSAETLVTNIKGLVDIEMKISSSTWNQDYQWFYKTNWTAVWTDLYMRTDSPDALSDFTAQMVQVFSAMNSESNVVLAYIDALSKVMETALSTDDWSSAVTQYPNLKRYFALLQVQDDLVQVMLASIMDSVKLQTFIEKLSNEQDICADPSTITEFISIPEGVDIDMNRIEEILCLYNGTALKTELEHMYTQIMSPMLTQAQPSEEPLNITALVTRIMSFQQHLGKFADPTSLSAMLNYNSSVWSSVITKLGTEVTAQEFSMEQITGSLDSLALFVDAKDLKGFVGGWNIAFLVLTEKMDLVTNRTGFVLRDLFPNSPNVQKMMDFMENAPDLVSIILGSLNEPKFTQMLQDNVIIALTKLCHPMSDITDYIVLPKSRDIDLKKLKEKFCSIDIMELISEMKVELHLIEQPALNGTVDWAELIQNYYLFRENYDKLMKSPAELDVRKQWTNITAWIGAMSSYTESAQDPTQAINTYSSMLVQLASLAGNDTMMLEVMASLMEVMSGRLEDMTAVNITLEDILKDTPALRSFAEEFLSLTPDIVEGTLGATAHNVQGLIDFFSKTFAQPNAMEFICSKDAQYYRNFFDLPETIDVDHALRLLCGINDTVLIAEIMKLVGVDEAQEKLTSAIAGQTAFNLTAYLASYEKFNTALQTLITNPSFETDSLVDVAEIEAALQRVIASNDFTDLDVVLKMYWKSMQSLLGVPVGGDLFKTYFNTMVAVMDYFNEITEQLSGKSSAIQLTDLLGDAYGRLIDDYANSNPEMIKLLAGAKLRFEKLNSLMNLREEDIMSTLCDVNKLKEYFILPDDVDAVALIDNLCKFNVTELTADLTSNIDYMGLVRKIMTAPNTSLTFDDFASTYKEFRKSLEIFGNNSYTELLTKVMEEFSSIYNMTWSQLQQLPGVYQYLEGMGLFSMDGTSVQAYGPLLNTLQQSFGGNLDWQEMSQVYKGAQMFMDVISGKLDKVPMNNATLRDVLGGSDTTLNYAVDAFALAPELFKNLLGVQVDFAKVVQSMNTTNAISALCGGALGITSITGKQQEAVDLICQANYTAIVNELELSWNWPTIRAEFTRMVEKSDYEIDWEEYIESTTQYSTALAAFFTNFTAPSLEHFMMYNGNMSDWLERLNNVWTTPAADDTSAYSQMIGDWLARQGEKDPDSLAYFEPYMAYLRAVQLFAKHMRDRLEPLPLNMTITQLLSEEAYMGGILKEAFAATPSLLETLSNTLVDPEMLTEAIQPLSNITLQHLFCTVDGLTYPSEEDANNVRGLLCDVDEVQLQTDVMVFIDWSNIMAELEGTVEGQSMSNFNWTAYMEDLTWIQTWITKQIIGPGSLADFFEYKAGMENWLKQLEAVFDNTAIPHDDLAQVNNILDNFLKTLLQVLPQTSAELSQMNNALLSITGAINQYLDFVLKDNLVSLDDILVNSDTLKSALDSTLKFTSNPSVVDILLNSSLSTELITSLIYNIDIQKNLCEQPLEDIFALPTNLSLSLDVFQKELCGLDLEALSAEVQAHVDWKKVFEEFSKVISAINGNGFEISQTSSSLHDSISQLQETFEKLLTGEVTADDGLTKNLATWFTSIQTTFTDQMSIIYGDMVTNSFASILQTYNMTDPWSSEVLDITSKWMMEFLAEISTDPTAMLPPTAFEDLFKRLATVVPDATTSPELAEVMIQPLFETMSMIPGLNSYLCNMTYWQPLVAKIGVDASSVQQALCGQDSTIWYEKLINQGLSNDEIQKLAQIMRDWTSGALPNLTITLNIPPLKDFGTDFASTLIKVFQAMNLTNELDLTSLKVQKLVEELTSIVVKSTNHTLRNTFSDVLEKMADFDDLLKDNAVWHGLKQYAYITSIVLDYTSVQIQNFNNDKGSLLDVTSLVPNGEAFSEILQQFLSPEVTQAILTASINVDTAAGMNGLDDLLHVICNQTQFSSLFKLEDKSVSVDQVQTQLCSAIFNNSIIIDNLLQMVEIQSFISKIEEAMKTGTAPEDFWKTFPSKIVMLVDNLKNMLNTGVEIADTATFDTWMNVLTAMNSPNVATLIGSYQDMCKLVVDSPSTSDISSLMGRMQFYLQMSITALQGLPTIEEMVCHLKTSNLTTLYHIYEDSPLQDLVEQITVLLKKPTFDVDCSELENLANQFSVLLNQSLMAMPKHLNSSLHCAANTVGQKLPALIEVDGMAHMLRDVIDLFQTVPSFDEFEPMIPALEMTLKSLLQQQDVQMKITDLLQNVTTFEAIVASISEVTPHMMKALMESSINLNLVPLYNLTEPEITSLLCQPDELKKVLSESPVFPLDFEEASKTLCNSDLNQTISALLESIDAGKVLLSLVDASDSYTVEMDWFINIISNLNGVFKEIDQLTSITNIVQNLDFTTLTEALTDMQQFLVDNGPTKIFKSLDNALNSVELAITRDSGVQAIFKDIKTISLGIRGLNVMKRYLPTSVVLRDLLEEPEEFMDFLESEWDFPKEIAEATLDSSIAFVKLLNLSSVDVSNEICDSENLGQLLTFNLNKSKLSVEDISRQLCQIDEETAIQVGDYLIKKMEISQLIKNLLSFSPDSILKKANITSEDLKTLMATFQDLQSSVGDTLNLLSNVSSLLDIEVLTSPTSERQQASATLSSLSDLICGRENAFSVDDSYGTEENLPDVDIRSKRSTVQSRFKRSTEESERKILPHDIREMNQLKSQFCKDIYLEITTSMKGKIIWTYLKPLLLGKIPFAPDTVMTRTIMEESMKTIRDVLEMQLLSDSLSEGIYDLADIANITSSNTQGIKDGLSSAFISSALNNILGADPQGLLDSLESFKSVGQDEANVISMVTKLISNITECVETDRLEGFDTEQELEMRARELSKTNTVLAGVVFLLDESSQGEPTHSMPKHIKYKIRTDVENVPSTERTTSIVWEPGPEDDLANDLRYLRGFVELQEMIDKAIIRLQTYLEVPIPKTEVKQFPYPCYERDQFGGMVSRYFVPIMMCLGWMVAIANGVRIIVYDRERQIEETMKVMGLKSGVNWLSWFISNFFSMLIMAFIIVLFLKLGSLMRFSDPVLLWLFLACFSLAVTMLCYLISAFFDRTTLAALTAIMVYLMSYLPYVLVITMNTSLLFWHKIIMALSCTTALSMGTQIVANFEQQGVGVQWDNVQGGFYYGPENTFTFVWCCYMLLIDAVVYGILGYYIRHVFPGKYGISQPWYFPLSPSYWGCTSKKPKKSTKYIFSNYGVTPSDGKQDKTRKDPKTFSEFLKTPSKIRPGEADPSDLPVGISLNHLTKKYSGENKLAVQDLSVNFYQEQITAFLGHNGAGKSSTIHVLTGVHEATEGTAYVNGMEIHSESGDIRKQMGFCPQHDALFDYLTVYEHLNFYSDLKSSASKKEKKQEVHEFLDLVGLRSSMHVRACQLSGGQKRRLSVALAFIGGSKVIILDEPTSGIDPAARRSIWDLIVRHRQGRTVLLCTHHLDEADAIGDRIVMLHQGKLVVSGSPMYLKNEFGSGYNLTVAKSMTPLPMNAEKRAMMHSDMSMCTSSSVLSFIQQSLPGSRLVEEIGSEITFVLPADSDQKARFKQLFERLEAHKEQLHINSYGVSDTSLEEVFLKLTFNAQQKGDLDSHRIRKMDVNEALIGDSANSTPDSTQPNTPSMTRDKLHRSSATSSSATSHVELMSPTRKDRGCTLKMRQFWGLLAKRFHHHRRDYRSYLSQIILPCVFVALAMFFTTIKPEPHDLPSLRLSPSLMPNPKNFFRLHDESSPQTDYINSLFVEPGLGTTCMNDMSTKQRCTRTAGPWQVQEIPSDKRHLYDNPGDCECTDGGQTCPEGAGGQPLPYWEMSQDVAMYNLTGAQFSTGDYILRTWKHFGLTRHGGLEFKTQPKENSNDEEEVIATVWYYNKGWHNMPSYVNSLSNMILRGSLNASQRANHEDYGITVYNHPLSLTKGQLSRQTFMQGLADTGIAMCILCAFCFVPAGYSIYLINENVNKEKRLQFICGVGTALYWGTSFLWDMMSYCFTVALATGIAAAFQIPVYTANLNLEAFVVTLLLFGWAVIPLMYLLVRFFKESTTGYMVLFLLNLLFGINTSVLVFLLGLFENQTTVIRQTYELLQKIFLIFPQFSLGDCLVKVAKNQLYTDIYARFNIDYYKNPFSFEMLGWNFVAFGALGAFFIFLNILAESRCSCCEREFDSTRRHSNRKEVEDPNEDDDVRTERNRVLSGSADNCLVTLKSLSKVYKRGTEKFAAVKGVSVGIPRGQCFGLLGVNGAGKTTTFNMMTGEVMPSSGSAVLNGRVISRYHPDMDQDVGYCPQFEALDQLCSVQEVLYLFCRLKGIPGALMEEVCAGVLNRFGLESYKNKKVQNLSGGTKRKLSTAVALLGDPSLVLLDEPTTGMDPQTRRLVWNNILRVLRDDRSVILTSHSMAECDALCTRMAIMVNGRFNCLGTGQHLKDKYGTGYTLTLRTGSRQDLLRVINYIKTTFPGSKVKDQHLNQVTLETPSDSTRLSLIFGNLEQDRHKLGVVDYSVRQTSLDQIFVNFARSQTDGVTDIDEASLPDEESGQVLDYPHTSQKIADKSSLRGYPPFQAEHPFISQVHVDPSQQVEVAVVAESALAPNVSIVSVHPPSTTTPDEATIVTVM